MRGPTKIAVAGATGRVGRHVVDVLRAGGHDVVAMSRAAGVDLITGQRLAAALAGVDCVVDAASGPVAARSAAEPVLEIAGPREEDLVDLARLLVARRGDPVRVEGVSDPAEPDRDRSASGGLLPGPDAIIAGPTFATWLDATS